MNEKTKISRDQDDQCILTALLDTLAPKFLTKNGTGRPPPANNAPVTYLDGDAPTVISKLFSSVGKHSKPFMEITPAELSLLLPKIKIFKMVYSTEEPKQFIRQEPVIFRDHVGEEELQKLFGSGRGRLGNVGIENFTMEQIGKTASVTNLYKVRLTLFAESIEAFLTGAPKGSAPYVDLITFSGKPSKKKKEQQIKDKNTGEKESKDKIADPTYFEIKLVAGWGLPKDKTGTIRKELKQALQYTEMVMKLNLVGHNINFSQDGTVKIELEYMSKIEALMDSFRANLFHPSPVADSQTKPKEPRRPDDRKTDEEPEPPKKAPKDPEITKEQILKLFKGFESQMRFATTGNIIDWYERQDLAAFQSESSTTNALDATISKKLINEKIEKLKSRKKVANQETDSGADKDPPAASKKQIPYVFLGDIIEAAVAMAQDPSKAPSSVFKYRVLVGPLTYISRFTKERININLGQVPVALESYSKFINDTILKKQATRMPLLKFLKSLVSNLVLKSLGSACVTPGANIMDGQAMKSKVDMTVMTHNTKKGEDVFKKYEKSGNFVDVSQIGNKFNKKARLSIRKAEKDQDPLFDYLVIYASFLPSPYREGNRKKDEKDGVYHYYLGRDRGVVNNINFSKVNMPARRTYLMKKEATPTDYLIERYNAEIQMIGNPFVSVGQLIHINPSIASLGDSRNKKSYGSRLGLTGYYFITRLTHTIDVSNRFVTKVHAVGQGSFYGKKKPINKLSLSSKKKLDAGAKKASEPKTQKGKGAQEDLEKSNYGSDNMLGAAPDAYAILDSAAYGDTGGVDISEGSLISESEPIFENKIKPPSGFETSLTESTPRILSQCASHAYAYGQATKLLEYLTAIKPSPNCGPDSPSYDTSYNISRELKSVTGKFVEYTSNTLSMKFDGGECPTTAYMQVAFRMLKEETYERNNYDNWLLAGAAVGLTGGLAGLAVGAIAGAGVSTPTWNDEDDLEDVSQLEWKVVSYSFNFHRHPTLGWFMYHFSENVVPSYGGDYSFNERGEYDTGRINQAYSNDEDDRDA